MSLQVSSLNFSIMQYNPVIQGSIAQQNEFFNSVNSTSEIRSIIDYSTDSNRLYERPDGSIGLAEKPFGYVVGEQIIAPAIESLSSLAKNMFGYLRKGFGYLGNSLSSIHNFQILPGASAQEAPCELRKAKKVFTYQIRESGTNSVATGFPFFSSDGALGQCSIIEDPLCSTKIIFREPAFFQQALPKHLLDTKQRNIVFIEPMGGLFPMIRRGKGNGYNIIILTQNERETALPTRILRISDWNIQVNTAMSSCVLGKIQEIAKLIEIDAVIPGMDFYVDAASNSAKYIGKPTISYEVAQKVRFKDLMRQTLKDKGVRIPEFLLLTQETTNEVIDQFIDKVGFPLVVKPVDCSGSVNVERVENKTGIYKALNKIINSNRLWGVTLDADRALIEEYIPGKEYSVEGIVQKEFATVVSITEKFVSDQIHFVEIGHISNPPMDSRQRTAITEYIKEVIKAIGINNAPFHAELRFNKKGEPVLMEIAARLCGDKIAELIRHTTGVNFYDLVYKVYLGEEINYQRLIKGVYSGVVSFHRKDIDVIRSIENVDRILANPNVKELMLYYSEGEEIHNWHWVVESVRVGHAILNNKDYESLKIELRSTDEQLIVK